MVVMAESKYVDETTLIGELVCQYPETTDVLLGIGMHCLGCPASLGESLRYAFMVHGVDAEAVVKEVNSKIAENRG